MARFEAEESVGADWFVFCCSYLKVAIDSMEVTDKPLLIDGNNEIDLKWNISKLPSYIWCTIISHLAIWRLEKSVV